MTVFEIVAALVVGAGLAYAFTPLGAAAGAIVVYLFSPAWRRPEAKN